MRAAVVAVALLLVIAGALSVGCGAASVKRQLTYSVSADSGQLDATAWDNRLGRHTTWIVLAKPPRHAPRVLLTVRHLDDAQANGGDATIVVPAGTYSYSVYSTVGDIKGSGRVYWTPAHRVGDGKVTVQ